MGLVGFCRTVWQYRWRIAMCALASAAVAGCVAAITPWTWRASMTAWLVPQTIAREQQGEFSYDADRRLAVQLENFRQVALSDEVLAEVLDRVATGPPDADVSRDAQVRGLRDRIKMSTPKGTEFGRSEMFQITVVDDAPARALAIAEAFKDVSQQRYTQLCVQKANALVKQASKACDQAEAVFGVGQRARRRLDRQAGADVHDLRTLATRPDGDMLLDKAMVDIYGERQKLEGEVREHQRRLEAVRQAAAQLTDADLWALPSGLLGDNKDLGAARAGLADLTATLAQLRARFTEQYPKVQAVRRELVDARQRLRRSLTAFLASLGSDLAARQERLTYLTKQERNHRDRLARLERMRIAYVTATDAVDRATERVRVTAQQKAAAAEIEARARRAQLLVFVDPPKVDDQPVNPPRQKHILVGLALGLAAGLGVALLSRQADLGVPVNV